MSRKLIRRTTVACALAAIFTLASATQLQAMPRLHHATRSWDASPVVANAQTQARTGFFDDVWSFLTSLFGAEGASINPNG